MSLLLETVVQERYRDLLDEAAAMEHGRRLARLHKARRRYSRAVNRVRDLTADLPCTPTNRRVRELAYAMD
jgi:hypothetical protein